MTVLPLADVVASELLVRWIYSRHPPHAQNALVSSNLTLSIINDIAACWPPLPTVAYGDAWKSFTFDPEQIYMEGYPFEAKQMA